MRNTPANQKRREAESRRLKVLEIMGNGEVEPHMLISNMDLVCRWLESGNVPVKAEGKKKLKLATTSGI